MNNRWLSRRVGSPGRAGCRSLRLLPFLAVFLVASGTGAAGPMTAFTGDGWQVGVGYPGTTLVLPDGEHLRHQVQTLRMESADARVAGRRVLVTHGVRKADGSADLYGTWLGEPGTWAGDRFEPSGGVWEGTWTGSRQADGRWSMTGSARGRGGDLEGLELEESASRTAGAEFDPAMAIGFSGRIAPPDGWYSTLFADDFEDGKVHGAWTSHVGWGVDGWHARPRSVEEGGVMTFHLDPVSSARVPWIYVPLAVNRPVTPRDGETVEVRMDLVDCRMDGSLGGLLNFGAIHTFEGSNPQTAMLSLSSDGVTYLEKRHAYDPDIGYMEGQTNSPLRSRLTLICSLTRLRDTNILLRGMVLDQARGGVVVYDRSWLDTPAQDSVGEGHDAPGSPIKPIRYAGFFFGTWPGSSFDPPNDFSLTLDNFSFRVYAASPYATAIERAVLLTPPPSAQPYVVEGAPTVNGPWTVLSAAAVEVHGVKHFVVPVSEAPNLGVYRIK